MTFTPDQQPVTNPLGQLPPTAGRPTLAPEQPSALDDSVILNLPRARTAFLNKYADPQYKQLPPEVFNSLARFDAQRVARGQNPISPAQTQGALKTLLTGEAATKGRDKGGVGGFVGDALSDIGDIARGVIRIPKALVDEAREIPNVPGELSEALSSSSNPLEVLSNVAQVPVVRFLPGAYVAENIQTPGELAEHPIFTALDVLPFASRAAGATRTVRTAREAAQEAAEATGRNAKRVRPLPTLALKRLNDGGELVPSRAGSVVNSATAILQSTRAGQLASATFGTESRRLARLANEATESVKEQLRAQGLSGELVDDFAREAFEHNTKYSDIDAQTRVQLGEIATEDPARIANLPDNHRAYLESYRRIQDEFAAKVGLESGELLAATIDGRRQIFDKSTGKRVLKAQSQVEDIARIKAWRDAMLDPEIPTSSVIDELVNPQRTVDSAGKSVHKIHDDLLLARLEVDGYDVSAAREAAKNSRPITPDMLRPRATVFDEALDTLRPLTRRDPVIAQLTAAVTRGDWTTAAKKADTKAVSNVLGDDAATAFIDDLKARRTRDRLANQYSRYNDRVLNQATRQVSRVESRSVPASFQPLITKKVREELAKEVSELAVGDPNFPQLLEAARRLDIGAIPYLTQWDYRALARDVSLSWRQMALELGPDHQPVFIHKVSPSKATKVTQPQVVPGAPAVTQTRARSLDATPYVRDLSVALDHQAVEWLQRRAADEFNETVGRTWGKSVADIQGRYAARAQRAAELRAAKTGVTDVDSLYTDELNRIVGREWAPFQHKKLPSQATDTDLFIPRYLSDNIQRLGPSQNKVLSNVVDPAMGVFRTSVLALSPRWHVYNLLGGTMLLGFTAGPRAFRHVARAREMVRTAQETGTKQLVDPRTGQPVPRGAIQGGMVSVPEDMIRWTRDASPGDKVASLFNFKGGQKARKLFDQARESRLAKYAAGRVEASYTWNGMVDDMYRTMAYLEGYDQAVRKGMSPEQAADAGVGLARKILANWDEMTPIERSVMRYWFPFYGFNSFLLQYVSKYPMDHPVRASITAAIARNEVEDHGDGLPLDFLSMFQIGSPDPQTGNVKSLNLRAVNPFSDVGDWFSTLGFMVGEGDLAAVTSNINPGLSIVLEAIGVDTRTGSSELFPDMRVDPDTGRLVADTSGESLISSTVTSFVPQSRAVLAGLGFSGEFQAILENNPDAAGRYLVSSIGLPVMLRDINPDEERISAEIARQEDQSRARTTALREGNFGLLREYPNLREYADVVEELYEQGLLDQFRPAAPATPNPLQALVGGLG